MANNAANDYGNAGDFGSTASRLDTVNMSGEERDLAKKQMRSIERTLDALWGFSAWLRSAFGTAPTAQPRKRAAA